jgi:predicted O-methyltransferase YrrM
MLKAIYHFLSPKFQNIFLEYKVDFKPRFGHGLPSHSGLNAIVDEKREVYRNYLTSFLAYSDVFFGFKEDKNETDKNLPTWNNEFLPGLDIIAIYGLIREVKPNKYVEIGSGNSTKVVRKAILDGGLTTKIISIDPYPRANIDELSDEIIRKPFESLTDFSVFDALEAGDIVFVDNSHRCLPNSDVTVFFLEILPRLKPGVLVQVHDIYLPYDYPQFMCDRAYSEQYMLAAFLLANPKKYSPILANYFISEDAELKTILTPIWENKNMTSVERHGGSFWFKIGE